MKSQSYDASDFLEKLAKLEEAAKKREEVQENRRDGVTSIISVMEEKVKVAEREGSDMKASKSDKTYDEIMSVVQETITKAAIIPSTIEADGEKGRKRREDLNYIVNCEMASSPQLPLALNRLDDRDDLFNIASSQQLDDDRRALRLAGGHRLE